MKKPGRMFFLIRVHDGKTEVIATTTGDVLEGETNLFSTYMIAYSDNPVVTPTATPVPTATPKPVPKTGDVGNPALWLGLILLGVVGVAVLGVTKPSRKRK